MEALVRIVKRLVIDRRRAASAMEFRVRVSQVLGECGAHVGPLRGSVLRGDTLQRAHHRQQLAHVVAREGRHGEPRLLRT